MTTDVTDSSSTLRNTTRYSRLEHRGSMQPGDNDDKDDDYDESVKKIAMAAGLGVLGVLVLAAVTSCVMYALSRRRSNSDEDEEEG